MVLLLVAVSNCSTTTKKKDDKKILPNNPQVGSLLNYKFDDPACQQGAGATALERAAIPIFENGSFSMQDTDFSGYKGNPLAGVLIAKTDFHPQLAYKCTEDFVLQSCKVGVFVKQAVPLHICKQNAEYSRESVESIALTSINNVNLVFNFYNSLSSAKPLAPISLIVLPEIQRLYPSGKAVDADNLAYVVRSGSEPAVFVFPKTDSGRRIWPTANLWESSWMLAHEGAHHIYRKEVRATLTLTDEDVFLPILKWGPSAQQPPTSLTSRTPSLKDVDDSINEGFADLMAFYSIDEDEAAFVNFPCFSKGRNLKSQVFETNEEKALSQKVLDVFLATEYIHPKISTTQLACDVPDYQDVHAIGAIIAHGINELFSASPVATNAASATKKKGEMLLEWLRTFNATAKLSNAEGLLKDRINSAIKVARQTKLTAEQCDVIDRVFPVYATEWSGDCG